METPPALQPSLDNQHRSSFESLPDTVDSVAVADVLLQILSRLTVYQSLTEMGGTVLAVRGDLPMMDACCLFLPSSAGTATPGMAVTTTVVEVLRPDSATLINGSSISAESPESRSRKLWAASQDRISRGDDLLFAKALDAESARVTSAFESDAEQVNPVGDYLCVFDFFYFVKSLISADSAGTPAGSPATLSVARWIEMKREVATGKRDSGNHPEWIQFCERSTMVTRASINLSQGISGNQVISGSTMNLSVTNLLQADVGAKRSLPSARSGGSSLSAVADLLARPWQLTLPLTVSTEKGVTSVFSYTNLVQLMAHVAMNCSDQLLEPFFNMPVTLEEFKSISNANLEATPLLDFATSTVADAIEVLTTSTLAVLVSKADGTFRSVVTPELVTEFISLRMDRVEAGAVGDLMALSVVRLIDVLAMEEHEMDRTAVIYNNDFPVPFSTLLQKLLLSKSSCLVVVSSETDCPVGIITVRDVWTYVLQGSTLHSGSVA